MTKFRNYLVLFTFVFFITSNADVIAQKREKSKKTVIVVKGKSRTPSNKVTYYKPKKKIIAVRNLPNKTIINHKGVHYYYSNNSYYTYSNGSYILITPKIGFRIKTLPIGHIQIQHPNRSYFWFKGVYYINVDQEYEVIEPEIGTVIYELPEGYERVEIEGKTFYEFSNVLYEKIQLEGTRAYEVAGFIEQ